MAGMETEEYEYDLEGDPVAQIKGAIKAHREGRKFVKPPPPKLLSEFVDEFERMEQELKDCQEDKQGLGNTIRRMRM